MVGTRIGMPIRKAGWGAACLAWCGLTLVTNIGFSQEQKEAQESPAEKPVATEPAPTTPAEPAPAVTFQKPEMADPTEDAAERKALEAAVEEFAKAFNEHDLKGIAAHYTTNAELTDQAGRITRGRGSIHEIFSKLFAEQPEIKIQLEVRALRFLSAELAVEEGVSTMTAGGPAVGLPPQVDRYTVTHIKHDGKWLIAGARDSAPPPVAAEEQIKQLEWLVGEWVDENSDTLVNTAYSWSEDRRYLLSKYSVHRAGQEPVGGIQRIGWDPQLKQLHSWTFDNSGGFSEGLWSRSGDQWIVKLTGVMGDGRVRSATNILTRLGPDHATFQSRDRVTGGEVLPDREPVPIVRKPPEPSLPKAAATAEGKALENTTESK